MTPPNEYELYKFCPHCGKDLHSETINKEKTKKCESCGFIFWNKSKPVVSVILHNDGKVLMIQRATEPFKNYWVLPGGFTSYLEDAETAIRREAFEEVGVEIKLQKIIGTYLIDNDPRGIHLDIIFAGTTKDEITLHNEDLQWKYFSPEELPDKIAYKHREAITDWFKKGSKYD